MQGKKQPHSRPHPRHPSLAWFMLGFLIVVCRAMPSQLLLPHTAHPSANHSDASTHTLQVMFAFHISLFHLPQLSLNSISKLRSRYAPP